jgi:branched-chain amino acid transport system permease protein
VTGCHVRVSTFRHWLRYWECYEGNLTLPGFSILGAEISAVWSYLILVVIFVVLTYLVMRRIVNSPFGRILRAVRDDEIAALAMGKNVNKYKIIVFVVGAFFAGIAGSLYAHYITFIDPSSFTVMESITILLMVVFGGMGNLGGSFVGAAILVIFPEMLRFLGMSSSVAALLRQMIYGLLLIVLMLKRPQGILGTYKWK